MSTTNKFTSTIDLASPPIKTVKFFPIKDSVIYDNEEWANYGASTLLQASDDLENKAKAIFDFRGLLENTSPKMFGSNFIDAKLVLYTSGYRKTDKTLNVYQYNDDNWYEPFVCWANAPEEGNLITSQVVKKSDSKTTIDVSAEFLNRINADEDNIGFCLLSKNPADKNPLYFKSKESTNTPVLILRYYDIPGALNVKKLDGEVIVKALVGHTTWYTKTSQFSNGSFLDKNIIKTTYDKPSMEINGLVSVDKMSVDGAEINGTVYVPKFLAFTNTQDNRTDEVGTEIKELTVDYHNEEALDLYNSESTGDLINGNVTVAKDIGSRAMINGEVNVWKGSAFEFSFFDVSNELLYQGVEINDILRTSKLSTVRKIHSQGDLVSGDVTAEVLYTDSPLNRNIINGSVNMAVELNKDKDQLPTINGSVNMSNPIEEPAEIDGTVIVDPCVQLWGITGEVTVPKFLVFFVDEMIDHATGITTTESAGDLITGEVTVIGTEMEDINGTVDVANTINSEWIVGKVQWSIAANYAEINGEVHPAELVQNTDNRLAIIGNVYPKHPYNIEIFELDPNDQTMNEIIENDYVEINGSVRPKYSDDILPAEIIGVIDVDGMVMRKHINGVVTVEADHKIELEGEVTVKKDVDPGIINGDISVIGKKIATINGRLTVKSIVSETRWLDEEGNSLDGLPDDVKEAYMYGDIEGATAHVEFEKSNMEIDGFLDNSHLIYAMINANAGNDIVNWSVPVYKTITGRVEVEERAKRKSYCYIL